MLKRFNYTKRIKIRQESVEIAVREVSGGSPIATARVRLDEYKLPSDAEVFLEAYRKASYMRKKIGTVGSLKDQHDCILGEFDTPEGVGFRLKVVGKSEDSAKDAPLLLAVADRIKPNEGENEDSSIDKKLLPIVSADLDGEIWRVDVDENNDGPVLFIDKTFHEERSDFVRTGWFFSLVIPTVFREVLKASLKDNYRELYDEDWKSKWLQYSLMLPGEDKLPENDDQEVEEWVNVRVEAFCKKYKMHERFKANLKGRG